MYIFIEKKCVSSPVEFKPVLFREQPYEELVK